MWRKIDDADFEAALNDGEGRAFSRNAADDDAAKARTLALAVSTARGAIRSGRKCKMPADETLLPDLLVQPTLDYAVYNVLKRWNREPNAARTKAYENAQRLFEQVATGAFAPEDYGETPSEVEGAKPCFTRKPRLLGRQMESGL